MSTRRLLFQRQFLPAVAAIVFLILGAGLDAGSTRKEAPARMGQVLDWSTRHILYPQGASLRALVLGERDPRAYWNYLRLSQPARVVVRPVGPVGSASRVGRGRPVGPVGPGGPRPPVRPRPVRGRADWSVSLGAAGMAASMFPAKYSFDVNATPDCTNDFVVFAINTAPSGTQANIAAFNNLYSGTAGGTGICGAGSATPYWAYQVSTVALPTSPILSLDGTKVAFVDGANPAVFHVLTWTANQGTVTAPATPTGAQIVNVTLTGATTDTLSPPFMDYYGDVAYVGSDNGRLFKITGVFRGTPTLAGSPWPRRAFIGTPGILTGPVIDFSTGEILVGSSDGNLYGFTKGGAEFFPLTIGSGGTFGGIVDAPIVDAVNGLLYVGTGEDSGLANAVVAQVSTTSFTVLQTAPIGQNGLVSIHAGALNNAYFNSPVNGITGTTEWFFYACGVQTFPLRHQQLWQLGFDGSRLMNSSATAVGAPSLNNGEACSPLTEIQNGVDRLFLGLLTTAVVEYFDISTSTTPALGAPGQIAEAGGTSGIIVDNVSTANQASSIYFTTLATSASCGTNFCAVKLTQGGLQ